MSEKLYEYIQITDLKDMLQKSGEQYGEKIAYKIKEKEGQYTIFTHYQVRQMVNYLGTALINLNLQGKKIAVIGENRYEWQIAYLAIACGTGIVVPLDKSLPENELRDLIERSQVEAIFYTKKHEEILKKIICNGVGKLKHLISMDLTEHTNGVYAQTALIKTGEELVKSGDKRFINAKVNPNEMNMMLFTSGTTSASKVVALSHHNICSNLMDLASVLDINCNDILLSFLPLHHVFECTVGFLFSLYNGAQTVFCDGLRHIVENLNEYHVSVMANVPAIYENIYENITRKLEKENQWQEIQEKINKSQNKTMQEKKEIFASIHAMLGGNIKLFISGAAALDATIEKGYRDLGIHLVQGYGLTETSPVIGIGNKKYHKIGSIGKSLPNVEAKIVDENEQQIGELVVKGPNIMLGYYENENATKEVLKENWFYTGDLAKIDEEGYIFICGRKKNVIVLKNGKNIFPEEMENLINRIEGVKESFVFGKQISEDENDIKIFSKIVYDEEIVKEVYKVKNSTDIYQVLNNKIKEINKTIPKYKTIKGMMLTQEPLIKTTTNKIKRQEEMKTITWN